ncbi:carbohydrate esterase [Perilla frutescens var. frutescens]|nr:carbohydrate esterase [Perilla frutescens var. frutescens]
MGSTVMVFATLIIASSISTALACNVFILAGQSNMAGRGGTVTAANSKLQWDGNTPPECEPNPKILRLNDELLWEEAREPLHGGISLSNCSENNQPAGIGPGMPFSSSLLERDPGFGPIGLVPCAVGGTGITEWSRGGCLYNRMLKRVRAALLEGGMLRGMLWYQGETDAGGRADADVYKMRLEEFFEDLRRDLMCPWLPIIQVALASIGNDSAVRERVRNAQLNTSLPNVKCVDAAGLPLNGDKLHLTTGSQVRLGSMLADAFLRYFN